MKRKSTATSRETKLRPPHYANTEYTEIRMKTKEFRKSPSPHGL